MGSRQVSFLLYLLTLNLIFILPLERAFHTETASEEEHSCPGLDPLLLPWLPFLPIHCSVAHMLSWK